MKRKIVLVVAAAQENRVIGLSNNDLPWPRIKADMKQFRSVTMGRPVIMGRVTFETFPKENGFPKPLPNRQNIVVTRNENYVAPGNVWIASSIEDAIQKSQLIDSDYICIIGGQQIYKESLKIADEIFYTEVKIEVNGTTMFPKIPNTFELQDSTNTSEEVTFPDSSVQIIELEFQHWVRK